MNALDKTLYQCLDQAKQAALPAKWDEKSRWTKAIALALKSDFTKNYLLCRNEESGVSVVRDFGSPSIIEKYAEIYPYEFEEEDPKEEEQAVEPAAEKPKKPRKGSKK